MKAGLRVPHPGGLPFVQFPVTSVVARDALCSLARGWPLRYPLVQYGLPRLSSIDYGAKCGKPYQGPFFFVTRTPDTMNEFYKNLESGVKYQ